MSLLLLLWAWGALQPAHAEPPESTVRLHFHRVNHDYTGWGLHVWGDGLNLPRTVTWTRPLEPAGVDAFGVYFDVPIDKSAKGFSFIVHRGDMKNVPQDQIVELAMHGREVWLLEDTPTVFTAAPPVGSDFQLGLQTQQKTQTNVYLLWGTVVVVALGLAAAWLVSRRRLSTTRQELAQQVDLLVQAQQQLQAHAAQPGMADELTGLPTRNGFHQALEQALARGRRNSGKLAVLFIDLDGFKAVNDGAGHDVGDHVLRVLAQRFKGCLRESDVVARVGGDEFVVLVESLHTAFDAARVGRKLVNAARQPIEHPTGVHQVGASVGIAVYPEDGCEGAGLVKAADTAMYQAKKGGKNACCFHLPELQRQWAARLANERALHEALERGELKLHYVPERELVTGQVIGAQAQLRWPGADHSVSPAELMASDDDGSLSDAVNGWALLEAGRQALAWQDAGLPPLRIAVPLAGNASRSFARAHEVLRGQKKVAEQLVLQWPASLVGDCRVSAEALHALRATGAGLALEHVSFQHLSLWGLVKSPLSVFKLDVAEFRSKASASADALARSLVALGRINGFRVVAQGVNGAAEREWALKVGCASAEAGNVDAAVPADQLAALLPQREVVGA